MHVVFARLRSFAGALALPVCLAVTASASAESWGTVKGRVVFDGPLPKTEFIKIDKDQAHCPAKILSQRYVVDSKTKGVQWVLVWLVDLNKPLPISPDLKGLKTTEVVIDQPKCMFEPPVVGVRVGQTLVVKNSAKIPHNVKVDGGTLGPNVNPILPPGGKVELKDIKPRPLPIPISCSIHGWMKGAVGVFDHPYFAVTNEKGEFEIKKAPVGNYRIVIWHPTKGWVVWVKGKSGKEGVPITIKKMTTVEYKLDPKEDDD
jgi:hypothetical protein